MFEFDRDTAASARDWSRHRALAMNAFSEEETQPVMVIIFDEGNEAWSAVFHVEKGWQDITVPFERFERFRWHQPAEASPNGRLDLGRVKAYEFQPTQILRRRSFLVDNVRLTNAGPKSGKRRHSRYSTTKNRSSQPVISRAAGDTTPRASGLKRGILPKWISRGSIRSSSRKTATASGWPSAGSNATRHSRRR
jgi:hypothetical protein